MGVIRPYITSTDLEPLLDQKSPGTHVGARELCEKISHAEGIAGLLEGCGVLHFELRFALAVNHQQHSR